MQFLKILFWCLLVFVAAVFTFGNWNTVDIHLWGGLIAAVNLPLLLLVMFLLGWVPTVIYYSAIRWRLRNRLATTERALGDLRTVAPTIPPAPEMGETIIEPNDAPAPKPIRARKTPAPAAPLFPDAS